MLDNEWIKSGVAAIAGAASTAMAFMMKQDRRITKSEDRIQELFRISEQIESSVRKSSENGERLARVETSVAAVARSCERVEEKIDRALQARSSI